MPHKMRPAVAKADTGRLFCRAREQVVRRGYTLARMQPKLKRSELDGLAEFYSLTPTKVETLLELADARPSRAEGLRFLGTCLRIARRVVAGRGPGVLRRRQLERDRGLRPLRADRVGAAGVCRGRLHEAAAHLRRSRRHLPRLHRHRRIARALRADVSNRRGHLRAVPDLGLVRPAAGRRRAVERGIGCLGARAQRRAAAVLRLESDGRNALGPVRRQALPARASGHGRRMAQPRAVVRVRVLARGRRAGLGATPAHVVRLRLRHLGGADVSYRFWLRLRRARAAIR